MSPFDVAWLAAALRLAVPIGFAATGELVSQLSGVLSVGLEGMILIGAFVAFLVASITGSLWLGVLGAIMSAVALAALMALFSIALRGDQIVVGIGLNVLALGIISAGFDWVFSGMQTTVQIDRLGVVAIPLLSRIPVIGPVLFHQSQLVYLLFILLPIVFVVLYKTPWGLKVRAAGESPEAADAAGVNERSRFCSSARWRASPAHSYRLAN